MNDKDHLRALVTYAFVGDALAEHNDYLMGFIPLLKELAEKKRGKAWEANDVVVWLNDQFGLQVSEPVAEFMASRLKRAGLIETVARAGRKEGFQWVQVLPREISLPDTEVAERKLSELLGAFREFLVSVGKQLGNEHLNDVDDDKLLDAIIEILHGNNKSLQSALKAIQEKKPVQKEEGTIQYLAARFIEALEDTNDQLFGWLAKLSDVAMLAEVIQDLQEPNSQSSDLKHMRAVYDSPLVIAALGLNGKDAQGSIRYTIDKLAEAGAINAIFSHSVEEIGYSLKALMNSPEHERTNETATALKNREVTEDYVRSVISDTDKFVQDAGFQIVPTNIKGVAKQEQFFGQEYIDLFYERLGHNWSHDQARYRDSLSVAHIMRKRQGKAFNDPMRCSYIFITHNPTLARISKDFCVRNGLHDERRVSPAITSRRFATLLWLNSGNLTRGEISRKELLLNCERLTSIDPKIIRNTAMNLGMIDPELSDQFKAMMMMSRPSRVPMDYAMVQQQIVQDEDGLRKLVEDMQQTLRAEEFERYEKALSARDAVHHEEITAKEEVLLKLKKDGLKTALVSVQEVLTKSRRAFIGARLAVTAIILLGMYLAFGYPSHPTAIFGWLTGTAATVAPYLISQRWLTKQIVERRKRKVEQDLARRNLIQHLNLLSIDYVKCAVTAEGL